MDIDNQVNQIVQSIIAEITTKVQSQVAAIVEKKVAEAVTAIDTTAIVKDLMNEKITSKVNSLPINVANIETSLKSKIDQSFNGIVSAMQTKAVDRTRELVSNNLAALDFPQLCQTSITNAVANQLLKFPEKSIPHSSVDFSGASISGDYITGGIIKHFGSTGIDDKATNCQLTIMDDITVVENNLLTKDLTVKGTTTIEGDLNVTGTLPDTSPLYVNIVRSVSENVKSNLDQVMFSSYADMVFNQIRTNGIDVSKLTVGGQDLVVGPSLGTSITQSNLQKLGVLQDLQVSGETLLSQTLYTTGKRVGINTIEPSQALSVWDQEIEIGIGKQSSNTAVIETPRNQTLVISSNGKNNLSINADGSISVKKISVGLVTLSSSSTPPSDSQPAGTVVFNANPTIGGPLGWISLGDSRWANFGFID